MDEYRHHVSGFFAYRQEAESTFLKLIEQGLPYARLQIFEADAETQTESNAVLKDVLVDGAIGTAVGAGIGASTELALVAASVTIFVASPLVAPLAMLGWGASLGGFIGATTGAVMNGVVSLSGKAKNTAEIDLVTKYVSDINGVHKVKNQMTVGK